MDETARQVPRVALPPTGRPHRQALAVAAVATAAVPACAGFVQTAVLARDLPIDDFGIFLVLQASVNLAAVLGRAGQDRLALRGAAEAAGSNMRPHIAGHAAVSLGVSLLTGIVLVVVLAATSVVSDASGMIVIILFWQVLESVRLVASESVRGFGVPLLGASVGSLLRGLVLIVAALWYLGWGDGIDQAIVSCGLLPSAFAAVASVIALAVVLRRSSGRPVMDSRRYRASSVFKEGLPLVASGMATLAVAQGDVVLVGAILGSEAAAMYGIPLRLASGLALPLYAGAFSVGPALGAAAARHDPAAATQGIHRVVRLTTLVTVVGGVVLVLGGPFWLTALGGPSYGGTESWLVLGALSVGLVVNCATGPAGDALAYFGVGRLLALISIVAVGTTAVLAAIVGSVLQSIVTIAVVFTLGMVLLNAALARSAWQRLGIWTLVPKPRHPRSEVLSGV
jgi:O-antigen/teichoic acid export membrane protein